MKKDDEDWLEVNGFRKLHKPSVLGYGDYTWWESGANLHGVFLTLTTVTANGWKACLDGARFVMVGIGDTPLLAIEDLMKAVREFLTIEPFHTESVEDWLKHEWLTYGWETKSN